MSFNSALTSGQLDSLRGTSSIAPRHNGKVFLSACPNTNVYTARVNQSVFGVSFAQINYDGGSGTLANVRMDMVVLISHTNDRKAAFFTGRVRKAPTSTVLYLNETSADIQNNDYVFIVDDYRILDKLPRDTGGVTYPDYDVAFRQLKPRIWGLRSAYVTQTTGSDGTFSFPAQSAAATSGATISSYLWEVGDGTITVGSSTSAQITATFPPGFRWIHYTVTDNGGRTLTRHIPVWVHDPDNLPAPLEVGELQVSATIDDGYSATMSAFAGVSTLLDNTLLAIWLDDERYNGTATNIVSNIEFVGRFRSGNASTTYDDTSQQDAVIRYEIEGPLQQLNRIECRSAQIVASDSPTAFFEITACAPWREAWLVLTELSTFANLHSLDFDNSGNTYNDKGVNVPAGSLLNAVNSIMFSLNARIQMNGAGEAEIVQDATLIPELDRDSLVTVADWDTRDLLGLDYTHEHIDRVGEARGSGGTYNTTSAYEEPVLSIAPGVAQGYPEGTTSLDRQVLAANQTKADAQDELNLRVGHQYAKAQGADELIASQPDSYWWLTPSLNQWYSFTLDGSETAHGLVLTTAERWLLTAIQISHDLEGGTREVQATYQRETLGVPGQTIEYPAQTSIPFTLPTFPDIPVFAFPSFDPGLSFALPDSAEPATVPATLAGTTGSTIKHDGNVVMVCTDNIVDVCQDFILKKTPTWKDRTPPISASETIRDARFAPNGSKWDKPGALVLTSAPQWSHTFDFTADDGGWLASHAPTESDPAGLWVAGVGWNANGLLYDNPPFTIYLTQLNIIKYVTTAPYFTSFDMVYDWTGSAYDDNNSIAVNLEFDLTTYITLDPVADGTDLHYTWSGSLLVNSSVQIYDTVGSRYAGLPGGSHTVKRITFTGTGANPFDPTTGGGAVWHAANVLGANPTWVQGAGLPSDAAILRIGATFSDIFVLDPVAGEVYYSSDKGLTFGAALTIGTPPASPAGFDTARLGAVSLAGMSGKVRKATTQGGAYSDYGSALPTDARPTAIYIPRYKFDGTNNGSGVTSPDYLLASDTLSSGGASLWKVTGGGTVFTDITPTSGAYKGLAIGPNCLHIPWASTYYQHILAMLSFNGLRKIAISTDSGATWKIISSLNVAAGMVTTRRSATKGSRLFATNGANASYSGFYGGTTPVVSPRTGPSSDILRRIDVLP